MTRYSSNKYTYILLLTIVCSLSFSVAYAQNTASQDTFGQVDLISEPTSYTPPFYKGKAYFVIQGTTKIVAMVNAKKDGVKLNPEKLNYRWTRNDIVLGEYSGVGKNTLIVNGIIPIDDIYISVEIFDPSGNLVIRSNPLILSPDDPKILFYENNPLYGILFNKAISRSYSLGNREELKIIAQPFFFNINGATGNDANYKWSVNGRTVETTGNKNELLLRQENTGKKGITSISLQIENLVRIFQYAGNNFNIEFGS